MTDRTTEAILPDVRAVLEPAGVGEHLIQVVALGAHGVRAVDALVGIWESVGDQLAGNGCLTELVVALQHVREGGAVRSVGPLAAEFTIVVAVVAVATEDARAGGTRRNLPVEVEHFSQQAGLRQRTGAVVEHGMAGRR